MSEPLLRVSDLHVEFSLARGNLRAVDGASFEVGRGEALGLVGESGSGKTVALRALVGLLPRSARIAGGSIEFEGVDVLTLDDDRRRELRGRSIAMVFQEPMTALNPVMRVGEQIAEAPLVRLGMGRRQARNRALELMRLVGVPDANRRVDAYPHELSGGLRQRVMIAIALSAEPKLVLCDEPTTALDVTIQDQILKLLLSLREELDVSLVFVSHDLAVIAQACPRVAVMYAGQIVETGNVDAVFREPRHPYTLGLLRSVPDVDGVRRRLSSIPGAPPDPAMPPEGCPFHPRCSFAVAECTSGEFPLRPLADGRATACIRDDACAEDARGEPVVTNA
jgi:peptide/nickel transport system ATP-binding protein/oligopeptide transport system ATP-binding protein